MWCLSCFKPSTYEDPFEVETEIAIKVSQHEADVQEAEQLDLAIQESSRLLQHEEEERRRASELEKDAQLARSLEYEEDEQLARTVDESLKEKEKRKQYEEQVKKDEQLALIVQESLNKIESPPCNEEHKSISCRAPLDVDEQLAKAVEESLKEKGKQKQSEDEQVKKDGHLAAIVQGSLKEKGKRKQFEDEQVKKDKHFAATVQESLKETGKRKQFEDGQVKKGGHLAAIVQESLNKVESSPRLEENNNISSSAPLDEHEQRIIWESLKGKGLKQSQDEVEEEEKLPMVNPTRSMCGGCSSAVEHGRSVNVLGVLWHPGCFCCDACDKPIAIHEVEKHVSNSRGKFHESCYQRFCYVCKEKKMRAYNQHPFWEERYCPSHEADGTPKCCSCERLEPRGTNYVMLGDGRWLCLECMDSSIMDSDECQPLHFDIREFFEGLNMKIEKEFPFLLVEKQALNKAEKEEKIDHRYEVVTRGICLSEAQTITRVSKRPRMGPNKQLIGMGTETCWYVSECEVTAILILYGLPRLLTGYILAHEMMHAYLRLNGHRKLNNVLEEGICQVLGHMWLESQRYASTDDVASSSSSSSHTPAVSASKKGGCYGFEKKLVEFFKNQIETDESPVYGVGFRKVNDMVANSSLQETLKEIIRRGLKRSQIQNQPFTI